jgi:hypothetical protein
MVKALGFIVTVSLLGMPLCGHAQGTSQQSGTRGGYAGSSSPAAAPTNSNNSPSVAPSRNSAGTSQNRTEGAYGLTPQLQKELGITRQQ